MGTIINPQDRWIRRALPPNDEIIRNKGAKLAQVQLARRHRPAQARQSRRGARRRPIRGSILIPARAADPVRIGLDNPLTGTYAAPGKNELIGCQMALDEINAKGGILGRPAELVVEDSTSGDAGQAVQKARKLIESYKVDFLLGNVNSALALAMAQVSNEKGILHIVPGGHTDAITGASCHWNVFRVCNTTQMEANAVASTLVKDYGKKFYYITPDYAFGHTLESAMVKAISKLGGERVGGDLTPLGSVDFSSYLIKAQGMNPDVIVFLVQGDDMLNAMKQAVQFGFRTRSIWPARSRRWSRWKACRPKRGSASGSWNGTGTSRACRMSPSSSKRRRSAPGACRRREPGSAMSRSGPARSPRPRPIR